MIWNDDSRFLLKKLEAIFSTGNIDKIQFHIFIDKNEKLRFPNYPWIVVHESLTNEKDATKIDLMFYLLQKCNKKTSGGKRRQVEKDRIYLIQDQDGSSDELAALLRSKQDHIEVKILLLNDNEILIDGSHGNRDLVSTDLNEMPDHAHCSRCNSLIGINAQLGQNYGDANGAGTFRMRNGIGPFALDNRRSTIAANMGLDIDSCPHCQMKPNFSYPREQQGYKTGLHARNTSLRGEKDWDFNAGYGGARIGTRRSYPMTGHEQCTCFTNEINGRRNNNYFGHFNGEALEEELLGRYDTEGPRRSSDKCQCSDDGSKMCFNCLLEKLRMSSSPELRFQRSGSAPALFFTGEFEDRMKSLINGNRKIEEQVIPVKVTNNKATSTEDLVYKEPVVPIVINKKPEMIDSSTDMDGFIDLAAMLAMLKAESTDCGVQVSPEIVATVETATNTEPIQIHHEKIDLNVSFAETVLSDYLPEKDDYEPPEEEFYVKKSFKIPEEKLHEYACGFCPNRKYRAKKLLEVHMKNNHKKCNCPCQEYFKTREDYLEHFYYIYPLPCLEDKKCPDRFRSLYYQSIHHRDVHHSGKPFFCIPCSQNEEILKKKTAFKDLSSLRIHASAFEHDTHDMFLISNDDQADDSGMPFSMRCSGINYC